MTTEPSAAAADSLQTAVAKRMEKQRQQSQRDLYDLAMAVCSRANHLRRHPLQYGVLTQRAEQLRRLQRQELLAIKHGLHDARELVREEIWRVLVQMAREAESLSKLLQAEVTTVTVATHVDVLRDMKALENEFPEVDYDRKNRTLTVVTDGIELEGIYLGPFEIKLYLRDPDELPSYEVVAVDSNPASIDSDVVHPHVRGNQLCEGEGNHPIEKALRAGRLFDFFIIVRQILESYNSHSAYALLNEWHGTKCDDCGCTVDTSDADTCSKCDCTSCTECNCFCSGCDATFCGDCSGTCSACGETFRRCFGSVDWAVMFILSQTGQTYARLQFNVGPGGSRELTTSVDFNGEFDGADHCLWQDEYASAVQAYDPFANSRAGSIRSLDDDLWQQHDAVYAWRLSRCQDDAEVTR